jgi:CheY-like chemotaxis protein
MQEQIAARGDQVLSGAAQPTGRHFLERRSRLMRKLIDHVHLNSVHIIDDSRFDAEVLASNLRKVVGRDVRIAISLAASNLKSEWGGRYPDVVFIDDRLGHGATALSVMPQLRRMGFDGPMVAVSGLLTPRRRGELVRAGASDVLHKDDFNSLRLIELLLALFAPNDDGAGDPS